MGRRKSKYLGSFCMAFQCNLSQPNFHILKQSLGIIQSILSDARGDPGGSCLFFAGCYRDTEVDNIHPVTHFINELDSMDIKCTTIHLDGISEDALNSIISDTTCMFPRLCKPLAAVVHRKTGGNPFFALEFLGSLVDRGLLQFSQNDLRWNWNECEIESTDVSLNVMHLLNTKMTAMSESMQSTLKVASCFGTKIDSRIVSLLTSIPHFSDFEHQLQEAVSLGLMLKKGSDYAFTHDKVREASYSLIGKHEEKSFHCNLGIIMCSFAGTQKEKDRQYLIAPTIDQINYGVPSLVECPERRVDVAELNVTAGLRAISRSDFAKAYHYFNKAQLLLPDEKWKTHYDLTLRLFLFRANTAFSCGYLNEADEALDTILTEGRCLGTLIADTPLSSCRHSLITWIRFFIDTTQ